MFNKLKIKLKKHYIKKWNFEDNQNEHLMRNINFDISNKKQKRVLISYLDYIQASNIIRKSYRNGMAVHTGYYELFHIIRAFIRLDYVIDVCSCNDGKVLEYIELNNYDVIFGFGDVYRDIAKIEQNNKIKKIFYLTENPYEISYKREKERIDYYNKRHNAKENMQRTGVFYHKDDELLSDYVITLSNKNLLSYLDVSVRYLSPSALMRNDKPDFSKRKIYSFMVFGTSGFIHKGIDLLIEVFDNHPEWELYICGGGVPDFCQKLGLKEIPKNIHDVGFISVNDDIFKEITDKCSFILLPSCSEGTSTGVLTGMCRGMIPIISRGSGLDDLDDYIYYFDGYHINEIEKQIINVTTQDEELLRTKFENIYLYSNNKYTLSNYENNLVEILREFDI